MRLLLRCAAGGCERPAMKWLWDDFMTNAKLAQEEFMNLTFDQFNARMDELMLDECEALRNAEESDAESCD